MVAGRNIGNPISDVKGILVANILVVFYRPS